MPKIGTLDCCEPGDHYPAMLPPVKRPLHTRRFKSLNSPVFRGRIPNPCAVGTY